MKTLNEIKEAIENAGTLEEVISVIETTKDLSPELKLALAHKLIGDVNKKRVQVDYLQLIIHALLPDAKHLAAIS